MNPGGVRKNDLKIKLFSGCGLNTLEGWLGVDCD